MAYQYLSQKITPFNVDNFNPYTFWKLIKSNQFMDISFNNGMLPLFKVDIHKDYYFIFEGLKSVNNIMNVHVCVGHSILTSFKIEFDYRTMSDTRKLIAAGDYNFNALFLELYSYPLIKANFTLKQIISITSKFHDAITFKFNSSNIEDSYTRCLVTVNFLSANEFGSNTPSVASKYYTIYLLSDDIAFEKNVANESDLGLRLTKFVKFTQHKNIAVLASMNKNFIYFVYNLYNLHGVIKADLNLKEVTHIRSRKQELEVASIINPVDIDTAFFGLFNRYFAESLVNYPSEHFISFAEQYGLDIDNVSAHACLTLVDMATV